jgi:hypothetical protein
MSAPLLARVPPQNPEAEQAVLGAMMVEREAITRVARTLRAEDFCSPQHQMLFQVMIGLFDERDAAGKPVPVDIVSIQALLQDRDQLEGAGGMPYLTELQDGAPTAAGIAHYARIVREKATLRALIRAGGEIQQAAQRAGDEEIGNIVARARATLEAASDRSVPRTELASWRYADFLARDDLPMPADVVEGVLRAGTVNFLYGPAGSAKSFAGADMARSKVSGWPWLGRFPCERGPAVLIEEESAPALLRQRLAELEAAEPLPEGAATLTVVPLQGLRLDEEAYRQALWELLRALAPKLVVVDTLAAVAGGIDLLELKGVRPLMAFFRQIATALDAAVLILAHSPKWAGKAPTLAALYGSEDLGAACDSAFAICRLPTVTPSFRVAQTKWRWTPEGVDLTFSLGPGPEGTGLCLMGGDPEREGVEAILLDALDGGGWVTASELKEAVESGGYSDRAGRQALRKLCADGKAKPRGATTRREYCLAEGAES